MVAPCGRSDGLPISMMLVGKHFMPGGGGYGNPENRDRKKIAEDIKAGLISADDAKEYE